MYMWAVTNLDTREQAITMSKTADAALGLIFLLRPEWRKAEYEVAAVQQGTVVFHTVPSTISGEIK